MVCCGVFSLVGGSPLEADSSDSPVASSSLLSGGEALRNIHFLFQ